MKHKITFIKCNIYNVRQFKLYIYKSASLDDFSTLRNSAKLLNCVSVYAEYLHPFCFILHDIISYRAAYFSTPPYIEKENSEGLNLL